MESILQGIDQVGRELSRKAVIVFTDGDDRSGLASIEAVEERIRDSDVTIYMITQGSDVPMEAVREIANRFSEISGGRAFSMEKIDELGKALDYILDDLRHQYLIRSEEEGIHRTMRAFEAAFENLSSASLKRLQPSLTEEQLTVWDRAFADNAYYQVEIASRQISLVSRTRARVDCTITRRFTPKQGGAPRSLTAKPTVIVLDRIAGGWQISSVRGPGWQ